MKAMRKAVSLINDDPTIYEHLGDVLSAMGMNKDALDAWEKSVKFHEKEEGLKERVEGKIKNLRLKIKE